MCPLTVCFYFQCSGSSCCTAQPPGGAHGTIGDDAGRVPRHIPGSQSPCRRRISVPSVQGTKHSPRGPSAPAQLVDTRPRQSQVPAACGTTVAPPGRAMGTSRTCTGRAAGRTVIILESSGCVHMRGRQGLMTQNAKKRLYVKVQEEVGALAPWGKKLHLGILENTAPTAFGTCTGMACLARCLTFPGLGWGGGLLPFIWCE